MTEKIISCYGIFQDIKLKKNPVYHCKLTKIQYLDSISLTSVTTTANKIPKYCKNGLFKLIKNQIEFL